MGTWKQIETVPARLDHQSASICAIDRTQWQTKLRSENEALQGTNLNADGVIIVEPLHCAVNIY